MKAFGSNLGLKSERISSADFGRGDLKARSQNNSLLRWNGRARQIHISAAVGTPSICVLEAILAGRSLNAIRNNLVPPIAVFRTLEF